MPLSAFGGSIYRALVDASPDAIVVVDESGKIVLVNQQTERLFGYSRQELLGQAVEMLLPDRFRAKHHGSRGAYLHAPAARPMGSSLQLHGARKDGSEFPVEISLSPISTDHGTLVYAAIRDVTERKRNEIRFQTLFDSAPDAMVVTDQDGKIVLINSQAEKLFGYSRRELTGDFVEVLMPKRMRAGHGQFRQSYMKNPLPRAMGAHLELLALRKDGTEIPVEISLSAQTIEGVVYVSSTIRDMNERRVKVTSPNLTAPLSSK